MHIIRCIQYTLLICYSALVVGRAPPQRPFGAISGRQLALFLPARFSSIRQSARCSSRLASSSSCCRYRSLTVWAWCLGWERRKRPCRDLRTAVRNLIGGFAFNGFALRYPQTPRYCASDYTEEDAGRVGMIATINLRTTTDQEVDPAKLVR